MVAVIAAVFFTILTLGEAHDEAKRVEDGDRAMHYPCVTPINEGTCPVDTGERHPPTAAELVAAATCYHGSNIVMTNVRGDTFDEECHIGVSVETYPRPEDAPPGHIC